MCKQPGKNTARVMPDIMYKQYIVKIFFNSRSIYMYIKKVMYKCNEVDKCL